MADSLKLRKVRLNPYTKHLLKENTPYIAIGGALILLTLFVIPIAFNKYMEHSGAAAKLEEDVRELEKRAQTLDTLLQETPEDLSNDVRIMQTLIPDFEDYFSVISTLEEISQKTNFIITTYTINLEGSKEGTLSLSISGVGDQEAFTEFLRSYNFIGGRLATVSNVKLGEEGTVEEGAEATSSASINLAMNFYSKRVDAKSSSGVNYKKSLSRLAELKNKISFVVREPVDEQPLVNYPTKDNPF